MKTSLNQQLKALGVRVRKHWSRQRKWQIIQRNSGGCVKCGKPAVSGKLCRAHLIYNRELKRRLKRCVRKNNCRSRRMEADAKA